MPIARSPRMSSSARVASSRPATISAIFSRHRAAPAISESDVLRFIRLLPVIRKPVIAAVDGNAIGIGTTLLFHCDLVYATPGSTFATPFLDLGLIPEAASSLLMPMRMGYARAFEMLVLGEAITAGQAVAAGFVNKIVAS